MTTKEKKLEMAQLLSKFMAIGINSFPREMVEKYCPNNLSPSEISQWFNSSQNVWLLRNGDSEIISIFRKVYDDAVNLRDIKVKSEQIK